MAIGRTFPESLQKALRSLEHGRLGPQLRPGGGRARRARRRRAGRRGRRSRTPDRPFQLEAALRRGSASTRSHEPTRVDPWFLDQIPAITEERARTWPSRRPRRMDRAATGGGPSGSGSPTPSSPSCGRVTEDRGRAPPGWRPACGRRSRPSTPAPPSSRPRRRTTTRPTRTRTRSRPGDRPKVVILGSGPNRIGQGIEFDYCCVHASFALRDAGFETSWSTATPRRCRPTTTPATASTSSRSPTRTCSTSSRPSGQPAPRGVIVALGGQTPLKLAGPPAPELVLGTGAGVDRPGRGPRALERAVRPARDPAAGRRHGATLDEARADRRARRLPGARAARRYVLGGRAMEIVYDDDDLRPGHGRAGRLRLARARRAACRPSARCSSTASSRTPPRSTSTPSATAPARSSSAGSWSTSRRPACTPATAPASSRRRPLGRDDRGASRSYTRASPRPSTSRASINVQYAVSRRHRQARCS